MSGVTSIPAFSGENSSLPGAGRPPAGVLEVVVDGWGGIPEKGGDEGDCDNDAAVVNVGAVFPICNGEDGEKSPRSPDSPPSSIPPLKIQIFKYYYY